MVVVISLILELVHILANMLGISTFSNILDGMPFYHEQNYLSFIVTNFLNFLLIVFGLSLGLCLIAYLFKKFFELIKKMKFNEEKGSWVLYVYLLSSIIYFEFFAVVSPTGPDVSIPAYDFLFRVIILVAPVFYFIFLKNGRDGEKE